MCTPRAKMCYKMPDYLHGSALRMWRREAKRAWVKYREFVTFIHDPRYLEGAKQPFMVSIVLVDRIACDWCGAKPIRENLDGDNLCQDCCNVWVRSEGLAAMQDELDSY